MTTTIDYADVVERLIAQTRTPPACHTGTLVRLVGMTLEARGIMAPLGALCEIEGNGGNKISAEVVGFNDQTLFLMPFTEPIGIGPGAAVRVLANSSEARLGHALLGRVIDAFGQPLDGGPVPDCPDKLALLGLPLNPMERGPINQILDVGVKAINGLLTMGRGQRIGLIAGSGVGKSSLLGMITRYQSRCGGDRIDWRAWT